MACGEEGFPPRSRIKCSSTLSLPAGTQRGQSPRSRYHSLCPVSTFPPSLPSKFVGILRAKFNCHLLLEVLPDPSGRRSHSHKSSCNPDCCTLGYLSKLPHTGQLKRASVVAQTVKNLPAMQETWVRSLGWDDPLEKERAAKSKRNGFPPGSGGRKSKIKVSARAGPPGGSRDSVSHALLLATCCWPPVVSPQPVDASLWSLPPEPGAFSLCVSLCPSLPLRKALSWSLQPLCCSTNVYGCSP